MFLSAVQPCVLTSIMFCCAVTYKFQRCGKTYAFNVTVTLQYLVTVFHFKPGERFTFDWCTLVPSMFNWRVLLQYFNPYEMCKLRKRFKLKCIPKMEFTFRKSKYGLQSFYSLYKQKNTT